MRGLVTLLACSLALSMWAQTPAVLTREAFVRIVLENHPMARQAALRPEMGEASLRSARGGFDPKATADYEEKRYDDKNYFTLLDAGLKVPTWYGVDLFAGFQENTGEQLNPQGLTPSDGLIKAGVEVPIGQGLFIDQRRATFRKAQAYQRATEAERQQLLNTLLLQALNDHTDWVAAYQALQVTTEAVDLANDRLNNVRGNWRGGDRPAIDTLEALLQVQDRQMRQQQAALNFRNAGLRLSNHIWDASQRPLELQASVVPDTSDLRSPVQPALSDTAISRAIDAHPLLAQASARIEQLDVDRRLRSEFLKPDLNVKYQWLGSGGALTNESGTTLLGDGHQLGVGFSMPLLLRRERGELSLAKLRTADAELGLARDRTVIRNRINERVNEIATYRDQVELGTRMVDNNARLLAGETQRFNAGESSLFLVNAREVPLIEARIRQVDLEARLRKAHFSLDNEAGTLWSTWR